MMENLREGLPPYRLDILPVLPVSEEAVMGVGGLSHIDERVYDEDAMLNELAAEHRGLEAAMEVLCDDWEFDGDESEYFRNGYAYTYKAIANQAELFGEELEDIDDCVYDAVIGNIQLSENGGFGYIR